MKKIVTLAAAITAFGFVNAANAADITPVYKAAPAAVVSPSGYYVWLDGMYDRVRLPSYALGIRQVDTTLVNGDLGPVQSFDPGLNGGGVRGAIGYIMPGSTLRFELGGSYIGASGSNSAVATTLGSGGGFGAALQFLNGNTSGLSFACVVAVVSCTTASNLSTHYTAWQFNGKVAADWKYGSTTVTPSAAIFGGTSRAGQTLTQAFTTSVGSTGSYAADTTLRWTDFGARAGLDVSTPLTPAFTVGLGGWVGFAERHTSLSGSDSGVSTAGIFNGATTISTSASKGVFLANLEAGLAYKVTQMVTLRGFAGLNYDGSVPGISSPSFTGSAPGIATSRTPAGISYAHETSYYAGGGLLVRFGG